MKLRSMLILILVLAFVPRILVFAYIGCDEPRKFYTYDSDGYVIRAKNLLNYGVFSGDRQPPFTPDLQRTPVYPLVLAVVFGSFGQETAVISLQILLGSLTALFTLLLARELHFSPRVGLAAACFVAVDPVSALLSNQLLTETLFTMELIAGLWLLTLYWREERIRYLVASAVVLALTTLTRPIAQFLSLALLPLFAIVAKRKRLRVVATTGLLFILVSGMLISTWACRNYRVSGVFTLSTITDINLLYYRARAVLAEAENISTSAAMDKLEAEVNEAVVQRDLTRAEKIAFQRQLAFRVFKQHPGLTVVMVVKGAVRLLIDPGYTITCTLLDLESTAFECFPGKGTMLESNILDKVINKFRTMTVVQQFTLLWSTFLLGLVYLGTAMGIFRLVHERNWTALAILVTVILYFVILSVGGETTYRFRTPMIPFLAILAGAGYETFVIRYRGRVIKGQ